MKKISEGHRDASDETLSDDIAHKGVGPLFHEKSDCFKKLKIVSKNRKKNFLTPHPILTPSSTQHIAPENAHQFFLREMLP